MSRMRYGKRFGSSAVSAHHSYNEQTDAVDRKERAKMAAIFDNLPEYRKELIRHSGTKGRAKVIAKRRAAQATERCAREAAEIRMAEAVRKCVSILEQHMDDLIQNSRVPGVQQHVNQFSISNLIVEMRNKCGVKFETSPQYQRRVDLSRAEPRELDIDHEDYEDLRARQREAREQRIKSVTERLINRGRS